MKITKVSKYFKLVASRPGALTAVDITDDKQNKKQQANDALDKIFAASKQYQKALSDFEIVKPLLVQDTMRRFDATMLLIKEFNSVLLEAFPFGRLPKHNNVDINYANTYIDVGVCLSKSIEHVTEALRFIKEHYTIVMVTPHVEGRKIHLTVTELDVFFNSYFAILDRHYGITTAAYKKESKETPFTNNNPFKELTDIVEKIQASSARHLKNMIRERIETRNPEHDNLSAYVFLSKTMPLSRSLNVDHENPTYLQTLFKEVERDFEAYVSPLISIAIEAGVLVPNGSNCRYHGAELLVTTYATGDIQVKVCGGDASVSYWTATSVIRQIMNALDAIIAFIVRKNYPDSNDRDVRVVRELIDSTSRILVPKRVSDTIIALQKELTSIAATNVAKTEPTAFEHFFGKHHQNY